MPRLLKSDPVRERYLMSEGAAWIISRILSQPMPGFEGISRLSGRTPMAWKTGTSYGFRDAWAFGIMGDYVAGVWVGRPDGTPCPGQYGAVTAIPLLQSVFESLPMSDFRKKQPGSVTLEKICWPSGTLKSRTKETCFVTHDAWILDHQVPLTLNPDDAPAATLSHTFWVDARGRRARPSCGGINTVARSVWPAAAEPWLPRSWKAENIIPDASPDCPDIAPLTGTRIHITSIFPGSVISRPPGQTAVPDIPLSALGGSGRLHWFLNGEPVAVHPAGSTGAIALPSPGAYQLAVADDKGHVDMVRFTVLSLD
jgi:penicillin-binding protein 1C